MSHDDVLLTAEFEQGYFAAVVDASKLQWTPVNRGQEAASGLPVKYLKVEAGVEGGVQVLK